VGLQLRYSLFRAAAEQDVYAAFSSYYLVQEDTDAALENDPLNVPAREGDEFAGFDECAVIDFLRMLGVHIELRDHYVTLQAPRFRAGVE
jgi:hypothetical protein